MAKKVRGHRANKPNDSFGTINNNNLYRGGYREDVYAEEDKDVEEQQAQPEEEKTEPSFVQGEAEVKHDYKKRYDDLKRHYDEKVQEFKDKEKQLEATLTEATRSQGISLPKTEEELVKFKEEFPDVYDVVETIATMKAGERAQVLEQELETIREKEQNTRVQAAYQELTNVSGSSTLNMDLALEVDSAFSNGIMAFKNGLALLNQTALGGSASNSDEFTLSVVGGVTRLSFGAALADADDILIVYMA